MKHPSILLGLCLALTFPITVTAAEKCTDDDSLGALVGQVPTELIAGGKLCNDFNDDFLSSLAALTSDGSLSGADVEQAIASAIAENDPETPGSYRDSQRVSQCEWAVIRQAISQGIVQGQPGTVTVADAIKPDATTGELPDALVDILYQADMSANGLVLARNGVINTAIEVQAGGPALVNNPAAALPEEVKKIVAKAKYNGALVYDYAWGKEDDPDELIFSGRDQGDPTDPDDDFSYPPISMANAVDNLAFSHTHISKATLEADRADTSPHLRMTYAPGSGPRGEHGGRVVTYQGQEIEVVDYVEGSGANSGGTVSSTYFPSFHALALQGYGIAPSDFDYPAYVTHDGAMNARTRDGSKWANNCGIVEDGSIHCLPAARNNPCPAGGCPGVLTNPAIARGLKMLWNGHVTISYRNGEPVITQIGTSGRVAKRAGRMQETLVDPVAVFAAWGIRTAPGVDVRSEHRTPHLVDHNKAIVYGDCTTNPTSGQCN